MPPKITCSILCYNYGRFLAQAIDSCLNQDLDPALLEVLVIDDGSTDETPSVCASYGDRIRVFRTVNQGFGRSLGSGVEQARGEYVAYLDADDWWAPKKLGSVLSAVSGDALVVMHPQFEVDEKGVSLDRIGACGNTSTIFVNRSAALTLLPTISELFCRPLADCGRGVILTEPLSYYRIHDRSMTERFVGGKSTEFFAKASHFTANQLFTLAATPPFWAKSANQLVRTARWHYAEGCIKDFERLTELKDKKKYFSSWIRMLMSMLCACRWFGKREFRLTARALIR